MKTLFYRTGGTMNFRWQAVLMVGIDGPTAEASLMKAGYPAIWADEAPVVFEPEGAIWPPHWAAARERKLRKALTGIAEYAEGYKPADYGEAKQALVVVSMTAREALEPTDVVQAAHPPQPAA